MLSTVTLACVGALAWINIAWAAGALVISSTLMLPVTVWMLTRHAGLPLMRTLAGLVPVALAATGMAAAVIAVDLLADGARWGVWTHLVLKVLAGVVAYVALTLALRPDLLKLVRMAPMALRSRG
jgi:hypothetical protein